MGDQADLPALHDAESYEVDPGTTGGPVDPPEQARTLYGTILATRDHPREPLVPAWLRNSQQRIEVARQAVKLAGYLLALHAKKSPKYAAKAVIYTPRGAYRAARRTIHWANAEEGNWHLRQAAASRGDADTWMKLDKTRERQSRWRWWVVGPALVVVLAGVAVLAYGPVPELYRWLVVLAAVPVFARIGRPAERPIIDRIYQGPKFIRLTADNTRKALVATGKVKDPADVTFPRDVFKDPPGQSAIVELPGGVIATDIIDKREQLAAGYRLPVDQVWPETVPGTHPGTLKIWVAHKPVSSMKQPTWPLLDSDRLVDYFQPFPYGNDIRMSIVDWSLAERNSLFGGIPGSGKSLAARNVALGPALDPLTIFAISELAGKGDFEMFEDLCPKGLYVCGADDRSIAQTMKIIEWLDRECEERAPLVRKYAGQGVNTTKKVNRAMAEMDPRLRPIVAVFDEFQEFASSPFGIKGDGCNMLLSVVKRARALGIHVAVATQRFDKDSCPKAISSLVSNRAALSVPAQPETDMILGTSAYRTGARPTAFVPGQDAGWMVRAGFAPGFETVRAAFVDDRAAEKVCERALAIRAGNVDLAPMEVKTRDLLDDVLRVFATMGRSGLHWDTLAGQLGELAPDAYGRMTPKALSSLMRAEGVSSRPVRVGEAVQKGCLRQEVADVAAAREITDGR